MIKLGKLTIEIKNWYLNRVEEEVIGRIKECKSIFEEEFNFISNPEMLMKLKEIEENIKEYLIEKADINLISQIDLKKEIIFPFEIGNILNIRLPKLNLIQEYNKICGLFSNERYELEKDTCSKKEIEEKVKKLNVKLKILKKVFAKKNKLEKQEKKKLKWEHFFKYIFDYNILSEKEENGVILRHVLLSKMNVKTCPYCDRNYITNYSNYSTADLDHFYSQSKYPFLALNIYNFIPACAICNRNLKKDKKIGINPREEEFGEEATFTLGNEIDTYMNMESKDIDITINIKDESDLKEKIETNIEVFRLKEIYKVHKDYILQMIKDIKFRGNENYLESIEEIFLEKEKIEILRELILKPYKFKIENDEPLGKLTKDILKEVLIDE